MNGAQSFDRVLLERAAEGHSVATQWFSGYDGYPATCAKARALLYRLAAAGLVDPVRAQRSGRVFWWRITDLGRARLAELRGAAQ